VLAKLPELLGRNFVIGYFLPSALGLLAVAVAAELMVGPTGVRDLTKDDWLSLLAAGAVVSWVVGVFLMAINFQLIRFVEGYGPLNPLKIVGGLQYRVHERLVSKLDRLQARFESLTDDERLKLSKLKDKEMTEFPSRGDQILPTSLGNMIRAFEGYPFEMYGVDGVTFWDHINMIVPKEGRSQIEDAKAQFDFWLNTIVASSVVFTSVCLMWVFSSKGIPIVPAGISLLITVLVLLGAYIAAKTSAMLWGDTIKAAFDLNVSCLASRFGLPDSSPERLRRLSIAIGYRDPEQLAAARNDVEGAN